MLAVAVIVGFLLATLTGAVATGLKGKWASLVVGLVSAPVWWVGGTRLARPGSWWARRFYGEAKIERARRRSASGRYRAVVVAGLLLALACNALLFGFFKAYRITSNSMQPTLRCARPGIGCSAPSSDRVLVLSYAFGADPSRKALVAFHSTAQQFARCNVSGVFIRRVIGLPGDTIRYDGRVLEINGRVEREDYARPGGTGGTWHVPAGRYFLMGDNRSQTCDSRYSGFVPRGNMIGRIIFRYWPPGRLGGP